jgi:hypothetical protein
MGVTTYASADKKAVTVSRSDALDRITKKLGVVAPKKVVWPTKPAKLLSVRDLKVELYQFGGFTRDEKPGAVLAFTSKLSETQSLMGVGFVLESDTRDADKAILTCVESLRADAPADAGDASAPR